MSRRRKPPLTGPRAPYPEDAVRVICTGGDDHPERRLADVMVADDGKTVFWRQRLHQNAPITDWRPADGTKTFRFRCPECRRDERLGELKLAAAIAGLRVLGAHALDISRLPC